MFTIRARTTILNLVAVTVSIVITTVISAVTIATYGHESASEELSYLCENGKNSIEDYLSSVVQSAKTVSSLLEDELEAIDDADFNTAFSDHIVLAKEIFAEAANNTHGIYTYYYRMDPAISAQTNELGFWYTNFDGKGFINATVTDLTDENMKAPWFRVPKETGEAVWLPPYVTDNTTYKVISYNVPIKRNNTFIGVVGIELSYTTLGDPIENISLNGNGYAFVIENDNCTIIYHPKLDILGMPENERPSVPNGFEEKYKKGQHHIEYKFKEEVNGKMRNVEKHCYWLELTNGMSVVVTVPHSAISSSWYKLINRIVIVSIGLITISGLISFIYAQRLTKPLKDLTVAAEEIDKGNYNVKLTYDKKNEIGILTNTVKQLVANLDEYISDLNALAYADALTSVANKSAFDIRVEEMQKRIDDPNDNPEFAIVMLDCDNLKDINDAYGHEKGDIYLRNSCNLMCRTFQKSTVYRIGGDEFAVILEGSDFKNRKYLRDHFIKRSSEISAFAKEPWEQIKVSIGVARFDPQLDKTVDDVLKHADNLMYTNKRDRKKENIK